MSIPDLSHSSIYHETKLNTNNSATELNLAVISPSLEPHGTVRSTRRARIVGVALELYYSKISHLPADSKREFCEFCVVWAGQNGDMYRYTRTSFYSKECYIYRIHLSDIHTLCIAANIFLECTTH